MKPTTWDQKNRVYLDACAAPGNKTSHLAALVLQEQQARHLSDSATYVFALDRSPERFETLQRRMEQLVSDNPTVKIVPQCQDFLQMPSSSKTQSSSSTCPPDTGQGHVTLDDVTDILLDPSCSGSGIFTSLDRCHEENDRGDNHVDQNKKHRLQLLSAFQLKALRHAMTAFPNVERIVYSTCSIHEQENEAVVAQALAMDQADTSDSGHWHLVAPKCLTNWPCRGQPINAAKDDGESAVALSPEQAACLIRVDSPEYETNGFFVACLQRRLNEKHTEAEEEDGAAVGALFTESHALNEIPLYPGRKALGLGNNETKVEHGDAGKVARASSNHEVEERSKSPQTVKSEKTNNKNKNKNSNDETAAAAAPILSRKLGKKLEWKRRQRESKAERLQAQKKAKLSNATTPNVA